MLSSTIHLGQGWATPGTRAELGTWARPRKRDPPPFNRKS